MRELIPTVKITNHAGIKSIKDGMKSNAYSQVEREKKPSWIRMTANQANQNYTLIKDKVKNLNLSTYAKKQNVQIYQNAGLEEQLHLCLWAIHALEPVSSARSILETLRDGLIKKNHKRSQILFH